jgi:hypothetical protein
MHFHNGTLAMLTQAASVPDLEAKKLSDDIKFLEKKFKA